MCVQEYTSKVGVCARINVYTCVCVYIGTQAKHIWAGKYLKRLQIIGMVGKRRKCPLSLGSRSHPSSAKDNGRKPRGKKGIGEGSRTRLGVLCFTLEVQKLRSLSLFS